MIAGTNGLRARPLCAALFAASILAGCVHSDALDPASASQALSTYAQGKPVSIDVHIRDRQPGDKDSVAAAEDTDRNVPPDPEIRDLMNEGLVVRRYRPGALSGYDEVYELTPKGQTQAASWKPIAGGYTVPLGTMRIGDVSNIHAEGDGKHAEADFTCTFEPNAVGGALAAAGNVRVENPLAGPGAVLLRSGPQPCHAVLVRLDDGWHVL